MGRYILRRLVVTAMLFIFAVLVVLFNLIADVLYTVLDPRLRLA